MLLARLPLMRLGKRIDFHGLAGRQPVHVDTARYTHGRDCLLA